jgi:ribosomal protein S13
MPGQPQTLSEAQVSQAVEFGKRFNTRDAFIKEGLRRKKFQIASAWAKDGISKYVTFYNDCDVISAVGAEANQKMRELSRQDLEKVPRTGLVFANVELHARGVIPERKLNRRYTGGRAHLVLQIDGQVVQPVREGYYPTPPKTECFNTVYLWTVFGTYSFGVGGVVPLPLPCGPTGPSKFTLEFAFQLTDEQMKKKGAIILIDGDGNRHKTDVDLSKIR